MITIPVAEFVLPDEPYIGIFSSAATVTVFFPGDEETQEWRAVHPPIDPLRMPKDTKRAEINAARDAAVIAPVSALGRTWDADEHSQSLLGKAILLASLGVPLPAVWRDYNGQDLIITSIDQLLAITGAMAAATQAAYTTAFARKDALKSATTLEEIEAI